MEGGIVSPSAAPHYSLVPSENGISTLTTSFQSLTTIKKLGFDLYPEIPMEGKNQNTPLKFSATPSTDQKADL